MQLLNIVILIFLTPIVWRLEPIKTTETSGSESAIITQVADGQGHTQSHAMDHICLDHHCLVAGQTRHYYGDMFQWWENDEHPDNHHQLSEHLATLEQERHVHDAGFVHFHVGEHTHPHVHDDGSIHYHSHDEFDHDASTADSIVESTSE